jgi:DNA repair protein SbcC/Rad50
MIPLQLTLRNFLSYQEAVLDFRGLQTACICGANGAGKSSLLEAMSWALWGESRAANEDDIIHQGESEARVDFRFTVRGNTYRVIRARYRRQGMTLDFQVETSEGSFRPLTGKNLRLTQQAILAQINLDYETFINSAYLRQGKADEFMLKRPGERKQILADLLKLQHYEGLSEKARDRARQIKGQLDGLEKQLAQIAEQRRNQPQIARERAAAESIVAQLQQIQIKGRQQLHGWQEQYQQRQNWQQQQLWHQQQGRAVSEDCQRLQQELNQAERQHKTLEALFGQEAAIFAGYGQWQNLQAQEEFFASRFQAFQRVQSQRQEAQQSQTDRLNQLQQQLQAAQIQRASIEAQTAAIVPVLSRTAEIAAAIEELQAARAQMEHYESAQSQASPLLQRQQQLQRDIDRATVKLTARLDELRHNAQQLQQQQSRQPQIQQAVTAISDRIEELDKLRQYHEQVREKGLERRTFMERLQANQRAYESQLAEVDQILRLLNQGEILIEVEISTELSNFSREVEGVYDAYHATSADGSTATLVETIEITDSEPPICPLCDRPLAEHERQLVLQKHQAKQQEILSQIWMIREQLAVSEREIQVLRQEYQDVETRLAQYGSVMQRQGQLQAQWQNNLEAATALEKLTAELSQVESQLRSSSHISEYQQEWQLLETSLQQLNYDERDHALARGRVDRWRWAEIKHSEIKQAQKRYDQLTAAVPELEQTIADCEQQIVDFEQESAAILSQFDQELNAIGYHPEQHNELRFSLRQAQNWQLKYQDLQQSRQRLPQIQQRLDTIGQTLQTKLIEQQVTQQQLDFLDQCLAQHPDVSAQIQQLELQLQADRRELDEKLSELGRLQQRQQQQEALKVQQRSLTVEFQQLQQQHQIYQELAQAFGKNGIPALMIENILPQLETMTNQILARLSANQLHIKFVTQRLRSGRSKNQSPKAIETLDILIADTKGTRPYETYSGGEAFRINFAIRLALARLLSQRSGTELQMLIVDEGFGTQDQEGIDRLIAAINAIAPDFACILTITHMAYFRDAFQSRIEVLKTETGSHLELSL